MLQARIAYNSIAFPLTLLEHFKVELFPTEPQSFGKNRTRALVQNRRRFVH